MLFLFLLFILFILFIIFYFLFYLFCLCIYLFIFCQGITTARGNSSGAVGDVLVFIYVNILERTLHNEN